jgi:hypothetical protein
VQRQYSLINNNVICFNRPIAKQIQIAHLNPFYQIFRPETSAIKPCPQAAILPLSLPQDLQS